MTITGGGTPQTLTMGVATSASSAPKLKAQNSPVQLPDSRYAIDTESGYLTLASGVYTKTLHGTYAQTGYTLVGITDDEHRGILNFDTSHLPISYILTAVLTFNLLEYDGTPTVWRIKADAIDYDADVDTAATIWAATAKLTFSTTGVTPAPPSASIDWGLSHGSELQDLLNADKSRIGFRITDLSTTTGDFLTKPVITLCELDLTYVNLGGARQVVKLHGGRATASTITGALVSSATKTSGRFSSITLTSGRRT